MVEAAEQADSMFPKLDDAQIERLTAFGEKRHAEAGEILFDQGDASHGVFVVSGWQPRNRWRLAR